MEYNINNISNKGFFNRILRNISSLGMNYDKEVARNTLGYGKNEDPYAMLSQDTQDVYARRATSNFLSQKDIPYLQRDFRDKQRILFEYSLKTEISTAIEKIADECIVYNENDFCSVKSLSLEYPQEVHDKYQEIFEKVYNAYGFNNGIRAWEMMRQFLISGYKTFQMVWNDKKTEIISFQEMDSETVIPQYDAANNITLWFQYPNDPHLTTLFLDSQIIHISYATGTNIASQMSYTEGLIRPYNQLKLLEQTRIMFNVINASVYQQFTIPMGGMGTKQGKQMMGELIAEHHESVEWDDTLGTLKINGSKSLKLNKQLWFPEGEGGSPKMDLISPDGHDLNEDTMLKWFDTIFKKATRIPLQRYEEDGGGSVFQGENQMTRDENDFTKFTNRIKSIYKELLVKPIRLMMLVEYPEYIDDVIFNNQIDIVFNKDALFETWKEINILTKKSEAVSSLLSLRRSEEETYLHIDYVTEKLVRLLTRDQMDENLLYWAKSKKRGEDANAEGGEFGNDAGGEDFGSGTDFDDGDYGGGEDFGSQIDMGGGDDTPIDDTPTEPDIDTEI